MLAWQEPGVWRQLDLEVELDASQIWKKVFLEEPRLGRFERARS
jgi:hypothetical protein